MSMVLRRRMAVGAARRKSARDMFNRFSMASACSAAWMPSKCIGSWRGARKARRSAQRDVPPEMRSTRARYRSASASTAGVQSSGRISRFSPCSSSVWAQISCISASVISPSPVNSRMPSPVSVSHTPISPGASSIISSSHSARTVSPARRKARSASESSCSYRA